MNDNIDTRSWKRFRLTKRNKYAIVMLASLATCYILWSLAFVEIFKLPVWLKIVFGFLGLLFCCIGYFLMLGPASNPDESLDT
jgi:hypothetical protein